VPPYVDAAAFSYGTEEHADKAWTVYLRMFKRLGPEPPKKNLMARRAAQASCLVMHGCAAGTTDPPTPLIRTK